MNVRLSNIGSCSTRLFKTVGNIKVSLGRGHVDGEYDVKITGVGLCLGEEPFETLRLLIASTHPRYAELMEAVERGEEAELTGLVMRLFLQGALDEDGGPLRLLAELKSVYNDGYRIGRSHTLNEIRKALEI
jgi:hypothetical protein